MVIFAFITRHHVLTPCCFGFFAVFVVRLFVKPCHCMCIIVHRKYLAPFIDSASGIQTAEILECFSPHALF